ncbi:leucine-rich repeat domain-containing protein [Fusibacillus kribbianus]|uniref:Leucine-rich repeat domain-containing protein n=1 Tax=Fusibacillus kribbianus TaxID=3044208 RepID=A0AAP4EYU6_9FIRM|nr:leucine-rich repeat domain-containing protein [Ruminococcus sp. YH-rum2234]MDI9241030.1 leucine-rich repeat domain-containing protein [Ruminococcus sp. YH-rum2234]
MKTVWDYIKTEKGIRILRMCGNDGRPAVPEEIDGCPVTEIGPYAFSAARLPRRFQVEPDQVRHHVTGQSLFEETAESMNGSRLKEIRLPASVTVIGDYGFYGCGNLEKIVFTDRLKRIGSGAFMGCSGVRKLEILESGTGSSSLYQMLSELRYALEVRMVCGTKVRELVVPEYYEASVENIPARILELHFQGTGYRYRQCFRSGTIAYRDYDELFRLAESQEPAQVLAELAYLRLKYPDELSGEARTGYLNWFSAHVKEAGEYFLERDDVEAVRLIAEAGGFDGMEKLSDKSAGYTETRKEVADGAGDFYMASLGESVLGETEAPEEEQLEAGVGQPRQALEVLLEMAGRMGRTEMVGCLMDYRHRKAGGGKKKKTFDL